MQFQPSARPTIGPCHPGGGQTEYPLSFFQRRLEGRALVYPVAILFTGAASLLYALLDLKLPLTFLKAVPLADLGLGWVLPAVVGILLGLLLSRKKT